MDDPQNTIAHRIIEYFCFIKCISSRYVAKGPKVDEYLIATKHGFL